MTDWHKGWRISRGTKPKFADLPRPWVAVKGNVALVDETQTKLVARLDDRKDELLSERRATFPNRRVHPTKDAQFS
jgi:hypothetical protein